MRRAVVATVLAATTAVVSAGSAPARGDAPPTLAAPHPCADTPGFTCSTLTVPLDHFGNARGQLALAVAAAGGIDDKRPVLILLTGGPGQPGVPFVTRLSARLAPVLDRYRLVMLDQRGTGRNALRCDALQNVMGSSDLTVPSTSAVKGCAAKLGAQRRFYTTADTVEDLELLRQALGVDKVTLDGISYGTFVAERYALAHPSHVAKLVLDSVVPHGRAGVDPFVLASLQATARVLRDVCRQARCKTDPAADLSAIVRKRHNGPELLDTLVTLSIADPTYRGVPALLHAARVGSYSGLRRLVDQVALGNRTPAEFLSQGLHASTLCGDLEGPWGGPATPLAGRMRALRRAAARLRPRDVFPFDRATASGNGIARTCVLWPPEQVRRVAVPRNLPAVPTLVLAGTHDLSTPLAWARAEAARAPRGKLVVVPGAGHSVQSRAVSDAGRNAVKAFLLGS
jgi:pimeloyl-ACP methyl ester carboxylesterase